MASGKSSKRARAAQRAAAAEAASRSGREHLTVWIVAAALAVVAAAIALGIVATSVGGKTQPAGTTLADADVASELFAGLPQDGVAVGRADAPVTLVEYVDLQCPFCRDFVVEAIPTIVEKHVRAGRVRLEVRGLAFIGPDSTRGLRAILAAGQQDHLFELMELLYYQQGAENSGWLDDDLLEAAARSIPGLDVERLLADTSSDAVSATIESHAADAERNRVESTPTIFVGPTGGELRQVALTAANDVASVERAIATAAG